MFIYVSLKYLLGYFMSLAEKLIKEFEENVKLRKRLAELLVSEPDIRLVLINAVIADVATKKDLSELRNELKNEISQLRNELKSEINGLRGEINGLRGEINGLRSELKSEISGLRREVHSNFRWIGGLIVTVWGATVIPILLKLIGAI